MRMRLTSAAVDEMLKEQPRENAAAGLPSREIAACITSATANDLFGTGNALLQSDEPVRRILATRLLKAIGACDEVVQVRRR